MTYGLKIKDEQGRIIKITPLVGSIVASGVYSSPIALNADNTYGFDIDLPGTNPIPFRNLAVISEAYTDNFISDLTMLGFTVGADVYYTGNSWTSATATYYTMGANDVMSVWTQGSRTVGNSSTWDPFLFHQAEAQWRYLGQTTFTSIRIFPAVNYKFFDASVPAFIIASELCGLPNPVAGVTSSMIAIIIKEWDY